MILQTIGLILQAVFVIQAALILNKGISKHVNRQQIK